MPSDPSPDYRPVPGKNRGARGLPPSWLFGLGFQFAAAIILGVLGGQWVDEHFGTDPWGVLVGAFLGFGAGFLTIYRIVNSAAYRRTKERRDQGRFLP